MTDLEKKSKFEKSINEAIELSKTFKDKPNIKYESVIMTNSKFHPSVDISCSQKTLYQQKQNNL